MEHLNRIWTYFWIFLSWLYATESILKLKEVLLRNLQAATKKRHIVKQENSRQMFYRCCMRTSCQKNKLEQVEKRWRFKVFSWRNLLIRHFLDKGVYIWFENYWSPIKEISWITKYHTTRCYSHHKGNSKRLYLETLLGELYIERIRKKSWKSFCRILRLIT